MTKTSFCARLLSSCSQQEAQAVTVVLDSVALTSLCQPPAEPRLPLCEHLMETQVSIPRDCSWAMVVDYNSTPDDFFCKF